ncbi:hypothetical protein PAMA_005305 [Pampus argenteus]
MRENSTQSQSQGSDLRYGRLLIGQNQTLGNAKLKGTKATKNLMDADSGYQADMGWGVSLQPKGQGDGFSIMDNSAVERLLKMEPNVECTGDSMKLEVRDAASTSGSLFFVDRGRQLCSPIALVWVTSEDVMPFNTLYKTLFAYPSNGYMPCRGHGCENATDHICGKN